MARLTPLGLGNRDGWGGRQRRSGRWVGRSDQNVVGSPAPTQASHGEFRDGDAGLAIIKNGEVRLVLALQIVAHLLSERMDH